MAHTLPSEKIDESTKDPLPVIVVTLLLRSLVLTAGTVGFSGIINQVNAFITAVKTCNSLFRVVK